MHGNEKAVCYKNLTLWPFDLPRHAPSSRISISLTEDLKSTGTDYPLDRDDIGPYLFLLERSPNCVLRRNVCSEKRKNITGEREPFVCSVLFPTFPTLMSLYIVRWHFAFASRKRVIAFFLTREVTHAYRI